MNKYYVYHIIDPKTGLSFYVGKGQLNRMYEHEASVLNGKVPHNNRLLFNKMRKVIKESGEVSYIKIKENLNEKSALLLEVDEIKKYGRRNNKTGTLCNLTDGGEGVSGLIHTNQTKEKMSKKSLEPYRIEISNNNLKNATLKNTGKRKLSKYHNEIFELYKTKSTTEICEVLSCDLGMLIRYLKENGWYVSNKNRKKMSEETKLKQKISHLGILCKKVIQMDKMYNILNTFNSAKDACVYLGLPAKRIGGIQACCLGKQKIAYGYKWKYENNTNNLINKNRRKG